MKGYSANTWYGLLAPAGTVTKLQSLGMEPLHSCRDSFGADMDRDAKTYTRLANELNLKAELTPTMFIQHPPTVRPLALFSAMPDKFRRTGVRSRWADVNQGGWLADSFLEGSFFDEHGNILCLDMSVAGSPVGMARPDVSKVATS